jgi:hypothetical protein
MSFLIDIRYTTHLTTGIERTLLQRRLCKESVVVAVAVVVVAAGAVVVAVVVAVGMPRRFCARRALAAVLLWRSQHVHNRGS